jgi:hypothetical protein
MFNKIVRIFQRTKPNHERDKYEPIYGFPREAVEEWLSRNPQLKVQYDQRLRVRTVQEPLVT